MNTVLTAVLFSLLLALSVGLVHVRQQREEADARKRAYIQAHCGTVGYTQAVRPEPIWGCDGRDMTWDDVPSNEK